MTKPKRNKYEFPYILAQRERRPGYWWNPSRKEWVEVEWEVRWLPLKTQLSGLKDQALVDAGIAIGRTFGYDLLACIVRNKSSQEKTSI